jgi:hypothetical protein
MKKDAVSRSPQGFEAVSFCPFEEKIYKRGENLYNDRIEVLYT